MSFWSRNKNKKDNPTSTTPTNEQRPPQSAGSASTSPAIPNPLTTANGVGTASPSPYANRAASANGPRPTSSPPDSPSTITMQRVGTPGSAGGGAWTMRKFRNVNPFPRFGHAANASVGKEGEIYVFGGLVKEKRKNDLYVIDSGSMTAYSINSTGEGPSPRLGHASLLVGNAFIVFGGECATTDLSHDDSLYLLNTSTRMWTRAQTVGPRPAPRYGHTLNILGSRLLVFGGQVDGYYFNDLVTFDLNTLSSPNARWELVQAVTDPPSARTGHICLSLDDKLVVFGGTDGVQWFNDTWYFDARSNSWVEIECTGHIPSPREGHAAARIGDVLYIFGGRGSDGRMLADLYAFKVGMRRWFSFSNIGLGPSARCGHTLTTASDKIIVLGGESASIAAGKDESTVAFVLDTTKFRFPNDGQVAGATTTRSASSATGDRERVRDLTSPQPQQQPPIQQQPSQSRTSSRNTDGSSRPDSRPDDPRRQQASRMRSPSPKFGSLSSRSSGPAGPPVGAPPIGAPPIAAPPVVAPPIQDGRIRSTSGGNQQQGSMRNRAASPQMGGMAQMSGINGSPPDPRGRPQERPLQVRTTPERQQERKDRPMDRPLAERTLDPNIEVITPNLSMQKAPAQLNNLTASPKDYLKEEVESQGNRSPDDAKHSETQHDESSLQPSPQITSTQSSSPSTEQLRKRLAWATTELALAQSRGYIPNTESFDEDDDLGEFFGKNDFQPKDNKLLQALLSTRHQLSRVKELVKDQSRAASERISEVERQRDEALSDAAYVRARLAAAHTGEDSPIQDDRAAELGKKLVIALSMQNELSMKVEDLTSQLAAEKTGRKHAEGMVSTHLDKLDDVDRRRQESSSALEEMRTKFHEAQRVATDERTRSGDHEALVANMRIETAELKKQVNELTGLVDHQQNAVKATKTAVQTAVERAEFAERELQGERTQRLDSQNELLSLKQQLAAVETQQSRLDILERQLSQAREEADAARNVMLSGLDTLSPRTASDSTDYEGRLQTIQEHLDVTKSLHEESREAHEAAVRDLAKANDRVATLESSQTEHIKEVADLQAQLSQSIDQLQSLQGEHTKVRTRATELQRDLDASHVKHSAIKQLFSERPASSSPLRSGTATPEFSNRIRELERQLDESTRLREDLESNQDQVMQNLTVAQKRHKDATKRQRDAEDRVKKLEEELERASAGSSTATAADIAEANRKQADAEKKLVDSTVVFQDRLAQLESDYQSAVHYVKGTEKMIRRMKEELTKYKSQNAFLQTELHDLKRQSFRGETVIEWETEKERLVKEIENLQVTQKSDAQSASEQIKTLQSRLEKHNQDRDTFKSQLAQVQKELESASERSKELEAELTRVKKDVSKSQVENELAVAKTNAKRLEQENQQLESRATEAEDKVSMLLDQVENSVDTYRRSILPKRPDGTSPPISPRSSSVGNRTSVALDSLAHELDQLRSHWESSSHRYRLSATSSILERDERDSPTPGLNVNPAGLALSPFDFNTSKVTMSSDDSSVKLNGVHELSSRWHDELDNSPSSHLRQVTA